METPDYIRRALVEGTIIHKDHRNLADLLESGSLCIIDPISGGAHSPQRVEKKCRAHHYGYGDMCVNHPDCSTPQNYASSDAYGRAWADVDAKIKAKCGNVFIIFSNKTNDGADGSCTVTLEGLACRYIVKED